MLLTILVPAAVLGVIVLAAVAFFQRGAAGLDVSPRSLIRVYLYLGSLVSVLVLVFGLSLLASGIIGWVAPAFAYGTIAYGTIPQPTPVQVEPTVPERPGAPTVVSQRDQWERQAREQLLQGATSAVVGALFFVVHWQGRRRLETADERASLLRRGYFLVGVAIFGVASIVVLPAAVYESLRYALIPFFAGEYRPGVGETLGAAIAVVPTWLLYLRVVLGEYRRGATVA